MAQSCGILCAEPTDRQTRHMVAEPMTTTLQNSDTDADTRLLHRPSQGPANQHPDHERSQPLPC